MRRQRWRMLVHGRGLSPADAGCRGCGLPVSRLPSRGGDIPIGRAVRMTHRNACRAALAFAALVVFASNAPAAGVSILGKWQIVEAGPAPWTKPEERAALAAAGRRLLNTEVTFAPGTVASKWKALNCKSKVLYDT